jgi:photosystem II stability/assembly factor-like uncharacterized protein
MLVLGLLILMIAAGCGMQAAAPPAQPPAGETWTVGATHPTLEDITFGNNQFVAVGDRGTILTSTDGATWTPRTSGTTEWLRDITFGNNQFVAVGFNDTILTSPDGTTWTR